MTDRDIFTAVEDAKQRFGKKCAKYTGAITVELIRRALQDHGLRVSPRDVFILGVPIEIDLLIPKWKAEPRDCLLYTPADVLAVIEVKNRGSFGNATIQKIRNDFRAIREANPLIQCCYLTLSERKGYRWTVTDENCDADAYTMFWHSGGRKNETHDSTGDWDRFVQDMKRIQKTGQAQ